MKLGKAIKMGESQVIEIEDKKEYIIAGVQCYGKGVVNRRTELGKNLKMRKYQVIEENYLMWCKVDTKNGAFGITKEEHVGSLASTNMALAKIDTDKFNPHFLERLFTFDFFHGYITHLSSGSTNRKYLTPKQLSEMVELPDLSKEEQDEFISLVDRIENLGLSSEITYQLDLVKQLRQAFLREAMQGKLTVDWRTSHPELVSGSHSASQLLSNIKAEKAKSDKKGKALPPIKEDEIPFEIPESWIWCRLGEIVIDQAYGTSSKAEMSGEIPVLRMGNITTDGKVLYSNLKYASASIKDLPGLYLKSGDLIFNRTNSYELVGKCAVFENDEPYTFASYLIRLRFNENASPRFFANYINSTLCREKQLEPHIIQQNGQANFNGTKLSNIIAPLPPLPEQLLIVAKLDELMQYCDQLEESIKTSQRQNEMLLQQVLREALEPKTKLSGI